MQAALPASPSPPPFCYGRPEVYGTTPPSLPDISRRAASGPHHVRVLLPFRTHLSHICHGHIAMPLLSEMVCGCPLRDLGRRSGFFAAISGRALPFRRACRRTDRHRLRRAGLQPFKKLVAGFPATGHSLRHSGCDFVLIYPSRFHLIRGTRSHSVAHPCSNDRDNIHNNHHHLTLQNDR